MRALVDVAHRCLRRRQGRASANGAAIGLTSNYMGVILDGGVGR
jgi:hypothetical protein